MKQLLQNMRNGHAIVVDVPVPFPRPGTARVRTAASLVSAGTERTVVEFAEKNLLGKAKSRPDLVRQVLTKARREGIIPTVEAAFNRLDQPMALGYSSAGIIEEIGEGLSGFKIGDRVACGGSGYAVHAEYAVVPQNLLVKIPPELDFESAAFSTLGAIALHGFRLAHTQIGDRVAVIGLGLLGLMAAQIALAAGCSVFGIDLNPERIALARQLGIQAASREAAETEGQSITKGQGVDAVLICADAHSSDPTELAGSLARDRGTVIALGAVGLNIPRKIYYEKELDFKVSRSYGPGRYDPQYEEQGVDYPLGYVRWTEGRNIESFVALMAQEKVKVKPLITHRFGIEESPKAYELITGKQKEAYLGVLLTYPNAVSENAPARVITLKGTPIKQKGSSSLALGVLGAGNYATAVFLPTIQKVGLVKKIGIATASGLSAQHAAKKFGFQYAASSDLQLIEDPDINLIAILTRHQHHSRQVVNALTADKNVFCEKPLALNETQLLEIEKLVHSINSPKLTVGFNRRFAPLAKVLKDFISNAAEPFVAHYRINAGFIPLNHWIHDPDEGGGRIIGEACHFVDFLSFLAGSPPVMVAANALPDLGRYHQDNVVLTCTFPDGSIGTISYLANGDKSIPKEKVDVYSNGRVAELDDFRSLVLVHNGRRKTHRSSLGQDKGHAAIWSAFLTSILEDHDPIIPYEHLMGVTRATFAAEQSLKENRSVKI